MNKLLIPILKSHSKALFPLVTDNITATIQWDGPTSFEEFENGLGEREIATLKKEIYQFTIIDPKTLEPAGSIDIRPDQNMFRADIGLWIGEKYHGQGLGTKAVKAITEYGFKELGLNKIEGYVFKGNLGSRRVFEKCGYQLEGTIRSRILKRGRPIDEWVFGILKEENK